MLVSSTSHFDGVASNPTPVRLHCYKLTVLLCKNNLKIINNISSTVLIDYIYRMAEWSKVLVSGTSHFNRVSLDMTIVMLHCYKFTVLTAKYNSKIINNIPSTVIDYIHRMTEWSKVLVSGASHFDGVGSDTTSVMLHCYKLTVSLPKKQFKNNKHHTFNCIDYVGRMAEWSKALVSGTSHFDSVGSNPILVIILHC